MRTFVVGLMMLGLAGCSFAPDYQRPQMELPQAWKDPGKGEQLDERVVEALRRFHAELAGSGGAVRPFRICPSTPAASLHCGGRLESCRANAHPARPSVHQSYDGEVRTRVLLRGDACGGRVSVPGLPGGNESRTPDAAWATAAPRPSAAPKALRDVSPILLFSGASACGMQRDEPNRCPLPLITGGAWGDGAGRAAVLRADCAPSPRSPTSYLLPRTT